MSSLHRVYVGGLPPTSSEMELRTLINKIVPVSSIYIPEISMTGLHRGFAIVEISGTDEVLKKCLRTFNACRWKGSRLRFESAKQHYMDRLDEEREQLIALAAAMEVKAATAAVPAPMKEVCRGGMLKLKCGKNKYTYVPTFSTANTIVKFDIDKDFAGDDTDDDVQTDSNSDSDSDSDSDSESENENSEDSEDSEDSDGELGQMDQHEGKETKNISNYNANNDAAITSAVPAPGLVSNSVVTSTHPVPSVPPKGGGRRLGFGTISDTPSSKEDSKSKPATSKVPNRDTGSDNEEEDTADGKKKKLYDDNEFGGFEEENDADAAYYDENALCVETWELEDETLLAERARQRKMLEVLMNVSGKSDEDGVISRNEDSKNGITEKVATVTVSKTLPSEKVNKWNVLPNLRFDPTALAQTSGASAGNSNGNSSSDGDSAATAKRLQYELGAAEQVLRDEAGGKGRELKSAAREQQYDRGEKNSTEEGGEAHFANISELKGIFQGPEGGESSVEQARTGDSLFSEAEKIGIDVREDTGSGLLFNFFDEENTEAPALQQPTAVGTGSEIVQQDDTSLPVTVVEDTERGEVVTSEPTAVLLPVTVTLPSLSFVFSGAFSFHRDMDEVEVNEVWKNTKEKLVIDYKRKSKEARKRKRSTFASLSEVEARSSRQAGVGGAHNKFDSKKRKMKNRIKKTK